MLPLSLWNKVFTATAAAAASSVGWWMLDCPPSLYIYDKFRTLSSRPGREGSFHDKNVWIVGASSGIGRELCFQLAASGCTNVIVSSRSTDKLERVASETIRRYPRTTCHVLPLDVCDDTQLQQCVQILPCPVDLVILNAGSGHLSPALETSPRTVRNMLEQNVVWPMILIPLLLHSDFGVFRTSSSQIFPRIAVTSSVGAVLPLPLSSAYAASKAALNRYLGSLRAERPDIRIDIWCPGPVDTDFHGSQSAANVATLTKGTLADESVSSASVSRSRLKMPVARCVSLMLSSLLQTSRREVWIVPQPTLTVLYLQGLFPGLVDWMLSLIGPKRVALWRAGLDLYDPASWTGRRPTASLGTSSQNENENNESDSTTR